MAHLDDPAWVVQDEHDVRPYVVTGGRTRPRHAMRLVSLLAAGDALPAEPLAPEAEQALRLCRGGQRSVAEIAATIGQPAQVTKIILSDLIDCGALIIAVPDTASGDPASDPDNGTQLLESLLAGLHTHFSGVA
ncbi:DUF742 domain-containing protein [Thermomonospora cellulosilytica]|uniref:DUF742 domain-containing protein n=1 Tax=Thermomonospora cellulosilytica TaxID=1411118 RepID=A0A7W3MVY2_9ACTN|nr:DUF742 domain-containing protein [Thermomonospora cellulosilytica]MBA9002827.1 hypothetical protein [Thermomonospora cellulosilytica]